MSTQGFHVHLRKQNFLWAVNITYNSILYRETPTQALLFDLDYWNISYH